MSFYGRNKPNKSEEDYTTPYTTEWIHTLSRVDSDKLRVKRDYTKFVSIDPGTRNFAIRIEARGKIHGVERAVKPLYYAVWDIATDKQCKIDPNVPVETYRNLIAKFEEIKEMIMDVDIIVIERQLPINFKSALMMHSASMIFSMWLKDSPYYPVIYKVCPKLKGRMLGAPRKISKDELKAWAVVKATELLTHQGDTWSIEVINSTKKADDLSDTVVQLEALLMFWGHPLATYTK